MTPPMTRNNNMSNAENTAVNYQSANREIMSALAEIPQRLNMVDDRIDKVNKIMETSTSIRELEHAAQHHTEIIEELEAEVKIIKSVAPKLSEVKTISILANKLVEI